MSSGSRAKFTKFQTGEPSGGFEENCITIGHENGSWSDVSCAKKLSYHVCEKLTDKLVPVGKYALNCSSYEIQKTKEIITRKENLSSIWVFSNILFNITLYFNIYSQMENGETGLHGVPAVQHAEEGLKPEIEHVPILHPTLEVLLVWVPCLKSKTAQPKIAQLVNISITSTSDMQSCSTKSCPIDTVLFGEM